MKNNKFPSSLRLTALAVALTLSGCAIAPKPFTMEERAERIKQDQAGMFTNQEAVSAPLTLSDAMARAAKYNLEHRLKIMEEALSTRQADIAKYDLLPKLTAAAGYNTRDAYAASSSMDIATGTQSLVPSTAQEKSHQTADLNLTWNILDFGVSYFQAQQQADRTLIMQEKRRKTMQNLMQSVQQAYWLAAGAQQMEDRVTKLLGDVDVVLGSVRQASKDRLKPSLEMLNYQRSLLDIVRQLEPVRNDLMQAKPRLAALMNLAPGTDFELAVSEDLIIPEINQTIPEMEEQALLNRPELIEADYQKRISAAETKKAIARLLPGIELSVGDHYDSNKFLVNNQWSDGGVRVTWNLLNLLTGSGSVNAAKAQEDVAHSQRLALNMAVLSQVHIANRDFMGKKREFLLANELKEIDGSISRLTTEAMTSGADNRLQQIRAEVTALSADLRRWQAYAAMSTAYAQVQTSIGEDPLPESVASYQLKDIASAFALKMTTLLKQVSN